MLPLLSELSCLVSLVKELRKTAALGLTSGVLENFTCRRGSFLDALIPDSSWCGLSCVLAFPHVKHKQERILRKQWTAAKKRGKQRL